MAALLRKFQDEDARPCPRCTSGGRFLRDAVAGEAALAAMAGDMEKAGQLFRQALAKGVGREGKVQFIAGKGPSDLLTLRALGALGAADVLIADEGAGRTWCPWPAATCTGSSPLRPDAEALVALAQEGKQIVRLIVAPSIRALVQALGAASVAVRSSAVARPQGSGSSSTRSLVSGGRNRVVSTLISVKSTPGTRGPA